MGGSKRSKRHSKGPAVQQKTQQQETIRLLNLAADETKVTRLRTGYLLNCGFCVVSIGRRKRTFITVKWSVFYRVVAADMHCPTSGSLTLKVDKDISTSLLVTLLSVTEGVLELSLGDLFYC